MNILIAGVTCSGKTTLANKISNACIMSQDNYFKDLKDIPKYRGRYLMDSVNAFKHDEYYQDAKYLLQHNQVEIPRYDLSSNRRISKDLLLLKKELVIFEGLHAIRILNGLPDSLKVFLLVDLEECLKRRIERDSELYNVPAIVIREYFDECVIPMYKEYIYPQIEIADLVIREGDDAKCLLKKYIRS